PPRALAQTAPRRLAERSGWAWPVSFVPGKTRSRGGARGDAYRVPRPTRWRARRCEARQSIARASSVPLSGTIRLARDRPPHRFLAAAAAILPAVRRLLEKGQRQIRGPGLLLLLPQQSRFRLQPHLPAPRQGGSGKQRRAPRPHRPGGRLRGGHRYHERPSACIRRPLPALNGSLQREAPLLPATRIRALSDRRVEGVRALS